VNYEAALAAYRGSVPGGWQAQNMHNVTAWCPMFKRVPASKR